MTHKPRTLLHDLQDFAALCLCAVALYAWLVLLAW